MAIKAIIHKGGRQPVIATKGSNLNSANVPVVKAPAVISTVGRKPIK